MWRRGQDEGWARLSPAGAPRHPTLPVPGRSKTAVPAPAPHLPRAELHFSLGLAFRLVRAVRETLGKPVWENAAVSFSETGCLPNANDFHAGNLHTETFRVRGTLREAG